MKKLYFKTAKEAYEYALTLLPEKNNQRLYLAGIAWVSSTKCFPYFRKSGFYYNFKKPENMPATEIKEWSELFPGQ